jgi:hypothetical protein
MLQICNSSGQTNASVTLEPIKIWLLCVLERQPSALPKPQSVLALDAFCGHLSYIIRNRLENKITDLAIIPTGMTSQIQHFDVSLKPVKGLVHRH